MDPKISGLIVFDFKNTTYLTVHQNANFSLAEMDVVGNANNATIDLFDDGLFDYVNNSLVSRDRWDFKINLSRYLPACDCAECDRLNGNCTLPIGIYHNGLGSLDVENLSVNYTFKKFNVKSLPDVSFNRNGEKLDAFDLNDYFDDVEGDNLNYTFTGNTSVLVFINGTNVSFSSLIDYSGSEAITFIANDSQNITSETITVSVNNYCGDGFCEGSETHDNCPNDCEATVSTPGGNYPCGTWECTDWSGDQTETRTCKDLGYCFNDKIESRVNKDYNKGNGGCLIMWDCSDWSECSDGKQTRTCNYREGHTPEDNCIGGYYDEPNLEKSCSPDSYNYFANTELPTLLKPFKINYKVQSFILLELFSAIMVGLYIRSGIIKKLSLEKEAQLNLFMMMTYVFSIIFVIVNRGNLISDLMAFGIVLFVAIANYFYRIK